MGYTKQDILVVMALREEGGETLENGGATVLYTGIGKVNATYKLTKQIAECRPKLVVNFGTAGSKLFKRGELVAANRFLQRDMDASGLGFKKFATPFEDTPIFLEFAKFFHNLPHGTVGTADSFETDHHEERGELVDMEAFALAKVCYLEKIDFACVKLISDGADDDAQKHWQETLLEGPEAFLEIYQKLLK